MKFKKLLARFDQLTGRADQQQPIDSAKLEELSALLQKKRQRYEERLRGELEAETRRSYRLRLKVIDAQLEKSRELRARAEGRAPTNDQA